MMTPFPDLPEHILVRARHMSSVPEVDLDDLLDGEELERLATISLEARRNGFVLGRLTLRGLLAERAGLKPAQVPLLIEPSGKPTSPGSGLHLSLAHSDEWAIAAASPHLVGVDIERIRDKPRALLDYILHPDERAHIESIDMEWPRTLFACWTLKEAVLKATGSGLRKAPRNVRLTIDSGHGRALVIDPDGKEWEGRLVEYGVFMSAIVFRT